MAKAAKSITKEPSPSTAVVKANANAVIEASADLFAADAGAGFEEASSDSYAIPFLVILQKGSPQVDEASGVALEGAKAGMLYNNVSGKLYNGKEGIFIVPCHFRREFLQWAPREGGGGFKGALSVEQLTEMRLDGKVKDMDGGLYIADADGSVSPKKNIRIGDHRNHFVLVLEEDGNTSPALLSLTSTQIKKSKQLMSMLSDVRVKGADGNRVQPAAFANKVRLSTIGESNDKGTWFGAKFELAGFVTQDVYAQAKAFYQNVRKGNVDVKYEDVSSHTGERASSADGDPSF